MTIIRKVFSALFAIVFCFALLGVFVGADAASDEAAAIKAQVESWLEDHNGKFEGFVFGITATLRGDNDDGTPYLEAVRDAVGLAEDVMIEWGEGTYEAFAYDYSLQGDGAYGVVENGTLIFTGPAGGVYTFTGVIVAQKNITDWQDEQLFREELEYSSVWQEGKMDYICGGSAIDWDALKEEMLFELDFDISLYGITILKNDMDAADAVYASLDSDETADIVLRVTVNRGVSSATKEFTITVTKQNHAETEGEAIGLHVMKWISLHNGKLEGIVFGPSSTLAGVNLDGAPYLAAVKKIMELPDDITLEWVGNTWERFYAVYSSEGDGSYGVVDGQIKFTGPLGGSYIYSGSIIAHKNFSLYGTSQLDMALASNELWRRGVLSYTSPKPLDAAGIIGIIEEHVALPGVTVTLNSDDMAAARESFASAVVGQTIAVNVIATVSDGSGGEVSGEYTMYLTVAETKNGFYTGSRGTRYYIDNEYVTGLHNINGVNFFFRKNGYMYTNGKAVVGGVTYLFDACGEGVHGRITFDGKMYDCVHGAAKVVSGAILIGDTYHFYKDGVLYEYTGAAMLDGVYYRFEAGIGHNGWVSSTNGKNVRYYDGGIYYTGIREIDGELYSFNSKTGYMRRSTKILSGGRVYTIGADGVITHIDGVAV